ncbi:metal ABC transporter permease [Candidatus Woesearchaeota archaeon]|nr:metal ABC transporter permease [Candidatus Woesearchaeota archaeon]
MTPQLEILLIASVVAVACSIVGTFLVLRRVSLMSDAVSHSILLGIVLAFFVVKKLSSPFLILGAAAIGVVTVVLTELLIRTKKIKEDASIGLVFPLLFSIGIILITQFAENVHIDLDAVLLGELAFAPFHRFVIGGVDVGPHALWVMGIILLVNLVFLLLFYKELKLATFDAGLAVALGFSPTIIHYSLMTLVSITAVGAFDAVGSILVVALMITPPATAYLLTHKLNRMLLLGALTGVLSAVLGYGLAHLFDASIAGAMALVTGILFLLALLLSPSRGLVAQAVQHRTKKIRFACEMLVVHLLDHEGKPEEAVESRIDNCMHHMGWTERFTKKTVRESVSKAWITERKARLSLTSLGRETAKHVMIRT